MNAFFKFKFGHHINNIINRPRKIVGVINRNRDDFTDKNSFVTLIMFFSAVLFVNTVRSLLSPYHSGRKFELEKMWRKCLRFILFINISHTGNLTFRMLYSRLY